MHDIMHMILTITHIQSQTIKKSIKLSYSSFNYISSLVKIMIILSILVQCTIFLLVRFLSRPHGIRGKASTQSHDT